MRSAQEISFVFDPLTNQHPNPMREFLSCALITTRSVSEGIFNLARCLADAPGYDF
ncbi:hypothetical protein Rcae01_01610 [Novipirellula caenicola]|uniref:Uncharacterized protein n=1 Tax=Novipirellula caenicola TaxID=1536901 RepID=A0ABP9VLT2_9BACT